MTHTRIDNSQDIMDSRDIIKYLESLESDFESFMEEKEEDDDGNDIEPQKEDFDDYEELTALRALAEQGEGSPDWQHGEALIRDSYFKDYAQELAEDCNMVENTTSWPGRCIDWDQAAEELQMDYMCIDFDGVDYWIHA